MSDAPPAEKQRRSIPILSFVGAAFIRLLHASLRLRHVRAGYIDDTPQYILAFWHENVLLALYSRWRLPMRAMISRSKDGEIVSRVLEQHGVQMARGSSSRGGEVAVREVLRDVRAGANIAVTPDGPKGPRREVKAGVVFIARATGLPDVPFHFTAKKRKFLRSWDRHLIPMPFSKAIFLYGEPIVVPREGDEEEWRLRIENAMNALADEAERDFDALWSAAPARLPRARHRAASRENLQR